MSNREEDFDPKRFEEEHKEYTKMMRNLYKEGKISEDAVFHTSSVDTDLPPGMSMQQFFQYQVQTIQPRMQVLSKAHMQFSTLANMMGTSNLECERYYRELYEDICQHEDVWFNTIFAVDTQTPEHCERTTGILGTLCTILRQRGDLEECMEIFPMYERALHRYQAMSARAGVDASQIYCSKELTYKYHLIRLNCGIQLKDKEMAVTSFRAACKRELESDYVGEANWTTITQVMGMDVDTASDDDIYRLLTIDEEGANKPEEAMKLRTCGHCEKQEEMFGDFKFCSRCSKQAYCNRECQRNDWKVHKILCGKNNTTKIESDVLLDVAILLTNNYATTVEAHTGKTVTKAQKKAAVPGLLKLFKRELNGKFAHFNSSRAFADGGKDPAFTVELNKYFAEQPGYEAWKIIGTSPQYREHMMQSASENKLRVDEASIRDFANTMATHLCVATSMVDSEKRELYANRISDMCKDYILKHPQYNSYEGMAKLGDDGALMEKMAIIACEVFGTPDS